MRIPSRRCWPFLVWAASGLIPAGLVGADEPNPPVKPTMIVVVGASGSPQYEPMFTEWADRWTQAARTAGLQLVEIGRTPESPELTDKKQFREAIDEAARQPGVDLWLVMIGHGTFDRRDARFNLRGPDVSAVELNGWLKPVDRPMAIINSSSASAPFLTALATPKRVVIVATKSGAEQNFSHFGDFLSQAIIDPTADLDKDKQTSLWEAYLRASRLTAEFYSSDGRLQTEHALLDDNGDGQGVRSDQFRGLTPIERTTDGKPLDGQTAHQWHLIRNATDSALPPDLLKKRDALESAVLQLRDRKKSLPQDEYLRELERLLVELAELNESATVVAPPATNP
ncbi:MAG: hypothetical protein JSS49_14740 [Planctomycetes bacterium]|nr:hypothetical protein [Planctomycetota bacterium]